MPTRTRDEFAKIMREKNCVVLSSKGPGFYAVISDPRDLPSDVELAGNDIVKRQHAIANIDDQINFLLRQKAAAEDLGNLNKTLPSPSENADLGQSEGNTGDSAKPLTPAK